MQDQVSKYDILFIVPCYGAKDGFIWKAINYRFQSPGVLSITAFVKEKGYNPGIFDCNLEQIGESEFEKEFDKRYGHCTFRYIGFSSSTQTINLSYRLSKLLKDKYPETKIIFGGAHASALPGDVLSHKHIDLAVIGEGELTVLDILSGKTPEEIKGLAYRADKEIIKTLPQQRIKNLDDLPVNAYDLVPMHLCKPLIGTYKKLPATILVTARGCPGRCTFCCRVVGNELSVHSPQRIIKEIEVLYYQYKIRQIIFYDDTFISDRKRIEEFCDLLLKSEIKISWTCSSRVDKVYPELLQKMKKAGCHQIMYGIESFNESVLKNINKRISPEDISFAIIETKKAGIEVRAAIMIGNPGDTIEILEDNIKQLKKLNPDLIQVTITTPIPGSTMFHEMIANGTLLTLDWDKYDGSDKLFEHETLSFETLNRYYRRTYLKFYLRPPFIFKQLFKLNSWVKIKMVMIGLFSIFPIVFKRNQKK
jgi:anaerobic magnesium-protoporphyrin IX monomethyl ester cyclase